MRYVGFNEYFHDGGIAIVEDGEIVFASSSERYSKLKYDPLLHKNLINLTREDDHFYYYEDPELRKQRIIVKHKAKEKDFDKQIRIDYRLKYKKQRSYKSGKRYEKQMQYI